MNKLVLILCSCLVFNLCSKIDFNEFEVNDNLSITLPKQVEEFGKSVADEVYFTLEAVEGRNSSFSEGYFVVKNIVEEEVEPADKTALGEAVESARLALAAVDLKQTTVTDGYDELKELYTKALTLSEDENATQEEVDAMVKELTDAEAYMQSKEAQREMLEIVSHDESTLTFKTNYFPYGVYKELPDTNDSRAHAWPAARPSLSIFFAVRNFKNSE